MNKPGIILIGGGGHCRACIDVIEQENKFKIEGIVERSEAKQPKLVMGYRVLGTDTSLPQLRKKYTYAAITVGQIRSSIIRRQLFEKLLNLNFKLPKIISPLAYVSQYATVGNGSIIMHFALVNAGASVGQNCIINSKALVEHDVKIEDHCHIASGAVLAGGTSVGNNSFFGSNSMAKEYITIGHDSLIGGGVNVLHDLPPRTWIKGFANRIPRGKDFS